MECIWLFLAKQIAGKYKIRIHSRSRGTQQVQIVFCYLTRQVHTGGPFSDLIRPSWFLPLMGGAQARISLIMFLTLFFNIFDIIYHIDPAFYTLPLQMPLKMGDQSRSWSIVSSIEFFLPVTTSIVTYPDVLVTNLMIQSKGSCEFPL